MRFRVDKKLSEKQLDKALLEQAKIYCSMVLINGSMSGLALAEQRKMMQYYEAWVEEINAGGVVVLPGQTKLALEYFD